MLGDKHALETALERLVSLGVLLKAQIPDEDEPLFFLNSQQGRAALEAIEKDQWQSPAPGTKPIHLIPDQPNIFKLYEQNIGAITPMMAEILKEDETRYPGEWIAEAIRIAVTRNIRNWKYVQAILQRWQKEGRGHEQNRQDDSQDPDSYRESWLRHG
jgi:DnaD/phage-associated family protein